IKQGESRDFNMACAASDKKNVLFLVDKSGFGGVQTIAYTLIERGVSEDVAMAFFFLRNINSRYCMIDIAKPNVCYSRAFRRYSLLPFFEVLMMARDRKAD